ncbi:hypothetical protein ACFL10_01825 [Patescibacteria group bacterium]
MNSLPESEKERMLNFLEELSGQLKVFKQKQTGQINQDSLRKLKDTANLVAYYRRFESPRKVIGPAIDKAKNKLYYETEHFIGDIVVRQEKFNQETIKYIAKLEKQIEELKQK